jgi:predicted acylesterase/phospholipase RssA
MMEEEKQPDFELGLTMAGAVSAGAYTAGVVDFLMEALETWERKKKEDENVPTHPLKIKVITGASAGSIAAAVFASSLRNGQFPFQKPSPLWKTWVEEVDIAGLLGINDFNAAGQDKPDVKSVLDSTFLDVISGNVLSQPWERGDWPVYVSNPLQLYFTVTNLRGIPYSINFTGAAGSSYGMAQHADYMHFALSPQENQALPTNAIPLGVTGHRDGLQGNWKILKDAALASGAFPIGLAARVLERTGTLDYDNRLWPVRQEGQPVEGLCECTKMQAIEPAWPDPWPNNAEPRASWKYQFINVDGGIANNEPFEIARRCLAGDDAVNPRNATAANRAVLMIDPFPNDAAVDFNFDATKIGLVRVLKDLMNAMTSQLRFKTEELELAKRQDIHSRWIIAPTRSENGQQAQFALASGGVLAFGGFLHRQFREHDYQLGRRNCQKFLRDTLVLHEDNSVFTGRWPEAEKTRLQRWLTEADGKTEEGWYLPVIPLYGDCDKEEKQAPWPVLLLKDQNEYFDDLRKKLHTRAAKLYFSWVDAKVSRIADRGLLKAGWYLFGLKKAGEGIFGSLFKKLKGEQVDGIRPNDIVQPLIDMIKKDFKARNLL